MTESAYRGNELDVFAHAANWKAYFRSLIARHLRGDVLEVGAGIGATTRVLCDGRQRSWLCLEADPKLAGRLREMVERDRLAPRPQVMVASLSDLDRSRRFDAILYIDVLEHIEDDIGELRRAADHLTEEGALIVLSPAHPSLYTPFDEIIGHHRRYTKSVLRGMELPGLRLETLTYLDSTGILLSLANRLLLRSGHPTVGQIRLWDRVFVPSSRLLDPLFGGRLGKSVLAVWRRAGAS